MQFLNRNHPAHLWRSFEEFCNDVTHVPVMRYAMIPVDATKPIGPGNFDWTFPPEASRTSKEGIEAHNKARRERQGDFLRDKEFRRKYRIGYADYMALWEKQGGVCACCQRVETKMQFGRVRMLSVDHDHDTDAVRGLLCGNCNHGIGM